jgi:hypothetical protein
MGKITGQDWNLHMPNHMTDTPVSEPAPACDPYDTQVDLMLAQHALDQAERRIAAMAAELGAVTQLLVVAQTDRAELQRLDDIAARQRQQLESMGREFAAQSALLSGLEAELAALRATRQTAQADVAAIVKTFWQGPDGRGLSEKLRARYARRLTEAGVIDPAWYLESYSDVREHGADPVRHYIEYGLAEGRRPHPDPAAAAATVETQVDRNA